MKLTPPIYAVRFNYQENTQPTKGKFHLLAYQETTDLPKPKEWKEPFTTVCNQIFWKHEPDRVQIIKIENLDQSQLCQKCSKAFIVSENSDETDIEGMKNEIKRLRSIAESIGFTEPNPIEWIEPS